MNKPSTYHVWRRSDGYVNATTYPAENTPSFSFEELLVTEDWGEALDLILSERAS